ncbi:MAG: sigma-70 family RNA polymerase sigma factor, partial [Gemmatimonadaceae bacterium]|nr:sigma-70 family RNA polymerase sigma factor [Gemmatimonadaceae bacterium]
MSPEAERPEVHETDLDLIGRWKAGESRAATRLVGRHSDALARFISSSGERGDVEEIVQDTFVRAFGAIDSFRCESSFRTWLFTIAKRLMLDRRRSDARRRDMVEVKEADAVSEYGALDSIIAEEAAERVRVALEKLSPTQREV